MTEPLVDKYPNFEPGLPGSGTLTSDQINVILSNLLGIRNSSLQLPQTVYLQKLHYNQTKDFINGTRRMSFSAIKEYLKSPWFLTQFKRTDDIKSDAIEFGYILDMAITQPLELAEKIFVSPDLPAKDTKGYTFIKACVEKASELMKLNSALTLDMIEDEVKAYGKAKAAYSTDTYSNNNYKEYYNAILALIRNEGKIPVKAETLAEIETYVSKLKEECPFIGSTDKPAETPFNSYQLEIAIPIKVDEETYMNFECHIDQLAFNPDTNTIYIIDYKFCEQHGRIKNQWFHMKTWYQLALYRYIVSHVLYHLGIPETVNIVCYAYYVSKFPIPLVTPVYMDSSHTRTMLDYLQKDYKNWMLTINKKYFNFPEVHEKGFLTLSQPNDRPGLSNELAETFNVADDSDLTGDLTS